MPDPVFSPEQEVRIRELALEAVRDAILEFKFRNLPLAQLVDAISVALNKNSRLEIETSPELVDEFTESLPKTTRKLKLKFGD